MNPQKTFSTDLFKTNKIFLFTITTMLLFFIAIQQTFAGPPQFNPVGEERYMNSNIFVVEGNEVSFTISAEDPDGDALVYSALDVPSWATFNASTGVFSGSAPYWADDYSTRENQHNVYDVAFEVTDGTYTVKKIVSIYVIDAAWPEKTVAELVAERPIKAGGEIGTPVEITAVQEQTIQSSYGGGKTLRKITFAFTSQVPDVDGWESDWESTINYVFLPQTLAVENVGAVIEGSYAQNFGDSELAERACAELDLPVLIIDRSWPWDQGHNLMEKYDSLAVVKRDPEYLFYTFTTGHYLRSIDALITVINQKTDWQVSYDNFKVVFTGHSKFGHSCYNVAAAAPDRVAGFMANGCTIIDTGASRLLGEIQGAIGTKPEAFVNYRAVLERYYFESLKIMDQMDQNVKALIIQGTDDDKNRDTGYTPKYIMLTADKQATISHAIGCLANAPHTTQTPLHATYWTTWLAHCLLDRPLTHIDSVYHYFDGSKLIVTAKISGETTVHKVVLWATDQSDLDVSSWNGFTNYSMSLNGDVYTAEIPANSTAYFVEVRDEAGDVPGLIASPPLPVDKDYPTMPQPPGEIANLRAETGSSNIVLNWTNPNDTDFCGIVIRCGTTNYPESPVSGELIYDGNGTTATHNVSTETNLYYTAFTYDSNGNYSNGVNLLIQGTTGVQNDDAAKLPAHFELNQNYPNPFNPETTIRFQLPVSSNVTLKIYDLLGNEICTLIDGDKVAGVHSAIWDGKNNSGQKVASGIYFYQIKAGNQFSQTRRMLFLK
ncbi:MAG: T9SS type A sorting domain-containing protein [Calditrichaeota bacterium]|nr:T9SS type A sorting domain-containing protein [Calditrichota bacterium]